MGSFFFCGVFVLSFLVLLKGVTSSLEKEFSISWASNHVRFFNGGQELQLTLDQNSEGANHDELDFEFLGNKTGEPYVVQTNVYASGKGDREQRIYLWFDPTTDFHSYGVVWTAQHILFMVDDVPIRVFKNNKAIGVPYPERQAMGVYSSLWNGDDWATQGGLVKIDWSHAPFVASYRNFNVQSMAEGMNGVSSEQWKKLQWVKKNFMIYNYCNDKQRYPLPPPECTADM